MFKKTTLQDIANATNLTPSGVSKALSNHPAMSETTKELVRNTAKKLNYQQNKIALSLKTGKSQIIGVIIPSAEKNFFGSIVHGLEKIITANNYNLLLFQTNESKEYEKRAIETFIYSGVECIIASPAKEDLDLKHYLELKKRNTPLILFDRADTSIDIPSVTIDDYTGGYIATEHLLSKGYTKIAHVGGLQNIKIFKQRLLGYQDALKAHEIPLNKNLIVYGQNSIESGKLCLQQLIDSGEKFDAVFAVEDFTALGVMQILKQNNIRIGKDVGLIGFANESFGEYISPSLSTINQQTIKMGEEIGNLFFRLNKKEKFYAGDVERIILEPILVERESTNRN